LRPRLCNRRSLLGAITADGRKWAFKSPRFIDVVPMPAGLVAESFWWRVSLTQSKVSCPANSNLHPFRSSTRTAEARRRLTAPPTEEALKRMLLWRIDASRIRRLDVAGHFVAARGYGGETDGVFRWAEKYAPTSSHEGRFPGFSCNSNLKRRTIGRHTFMPRGKY
jgi:hypothetical protein